MKRLVVVLALACGLVYAFPAASVAQIGVGPRLSYVRGDAAAPETASARYTGGVLRARTSPRTALELALDYRTTTDPSTGEKTRDLPFQGSVLLYPVRSSIGVYVLGGVGWYNQKVQTVTVPTATTSTTKMGYHAGVGGELALGRHAALHVDYRYTAIRFGDEGAAPSTGAIPIPGLTGLQQKLKLSHQGSMWTTGVTVYF